MGPDDYARMLSGRPEKQPPAWVTKVSVKMR